jgi:hypothetical protein
MRFMTRFLVGLLIGATFDEVAVLKFHPLHVVQIEGPEVLGLVHVLSGRN